jgi:uncharacterized protein YndB with AHSA1/START domain
MWPRIIYGLKNVGQKIVRTFAGKRPTVSTLIKANPSIIWALLTHAADYKRWNSTIISLEGTIAEGSQIRLVATLDPKRTFKLKVKKFIPEQKLIWGDAMGARSFTLETQGDGNVLWTMSERIGGPIFPLFARFIPPFDAAFDQFAQDLKKEAEKIQETNK